MEAIKDINDRDNLRENKIIGNPKLSNSTIAFTGKNNILVCEDNINIVNSSIRFHGNDSVVYLGYTTSNYALDINVFQNSTVFIGKDNKLSPTLHINVQEHQNFIMGDDCIVGSNFNARTADAHIVYDVNTKKRINYSSSVFIGDHVWLAHQVYVEMGAKIGSGAIVNNNSHVYKNSILNSNNLYSGNPAQLVREDVFFTKEYTGNFTEEDTLSYDDYNSRLFIFGVDKSESLDLNKIDELISDLDPDKRVELIEKLFIKNKLHNRFSI